MDGPARDSDETLALLEQVRAGSAEAADALFTRHRAALRRFVELRLDPRLRGRADASDVVQETQLEAFRRMPEYLRRRPMPFRLWLLRTAYERLLKLRRFHVSAGRRAVGREVALPDNSSHQLLAELGSSTTAPGHKLESARDGPGSAPGREPALGAGPGDPAFAQL